MDAPNVSGYAMVSLAYCLKAITFTSVCQLHRDIHECAVNHEDHVHRHFSSAATRASDSGWAVMGGDYFNDRITELVFLTCTVLEYLLELGEGRLATKAMYSKLWLVKLTETVPKIRISASNSITCN